MTKQGIVDGNFILSSVGVSRYSKDVGWLYQVCLRYRSIRQSQVFIQPGSWGPEVVWMVEGTFKQKQIVKQAGWRRHTVRSGELGSNNRKRKETVCGSWRVYIFNALTDWGMIGFGHAWANMIPFPLMKPLSKHTHKHPCSTSAKEVREDNRRVCFKIRHGLYLQGCFFSWLDCTILIYCCLAYALTQ